MNSGKEESMLAGQDMTIRHGFAELSSQEQQDVSTLVEACPGNALYRWLHVVERACVTQGYLPLYHVLKDDNKVVGFSFGMMLPGIKVRGGRAVAGPIRVFMGMLPLSSSGCFFVAPHARERFFQSYTGLLPTRRMPYVHMVLPYPAYESEFRNQVGGGLISIPFHPTAHLDLHFRDFNDYLSALTVSQRRNIRKAIDVFTRHGGSFDRCMDPRPHAQRLYELYLNVCKKNEKHGSPFLLHPTFFSELDETLGDRYRLIVAKIDGKIMGFALVLKKGVVFDLRFVGQDYGCARETSLYFNLYYESIRMGIDEGVSRLDLGLTEVEVKRRLGSYFKQPSAFVGSSSLWFTRLLQWTGMIAEDRYVKN